MQCPSAITITFEPCGQQDRSFYSSLCRLYDALLKSVWSSNPLSSPNDSRCTTSITSAPLMISGTFWRSEDSCWTSTVEEAVTSFRDSSKGTAVAVGSSSSLSRSPNRSSATWPPPVVPFVPLSGPGPLGVLGRTVRYSLRPLAPPECLVT